MENILSGSEVFNVGQTDRQNDDLISLLSFLESRLKMDPDKATVTNILVS
jgi:hypothetical protein